MSLSVSRQWRASMPTPITLALVTTSLCCCSCSGCLTCRVRGTFSCWWLSGWLLFVVAPCPVAPWLWRRAWWGLCCRCSHSPRVSTGNVQMPYWASWRTWALCVWDQRSWRACSDCSGWIRTMAQWWGGCTPTALAWSEFSQPWQPEKARTAPCSTLILRPPWQELWCPQSNAGQAAGLPFTPGYASTWSSPPATQSSPATVNLLPTLAQGLSMTWEKDHAGNSSTGKGTHLWKLSWIASFYIYMYILHCAIFDRIFFFV